MFLIIFLMFFLLSLIAKGQSKSKIKKRTECERKRINVILQNVEAYDGSGRGQKRLEDFK